MQDLINNLPKLAKDKHKENKSFFAKLKKKPPKQLDYLMQELHVEEFKRTDCLECANCCKTTGPLFTDKDIDITLKDGVLYVEGNQGDNDERTYLHRGLSARSFRRSFTIADTIVVNGADFVNGILTISLENVIPEEKKPRKIPIHDGNQKAEMLNG